MNIPEKVRISGVDYRILQVPELKNSKQPVDGYIDYGESTIKLSLVTNKHKKEQQYKCVVLWHEILHGISCHANLDLGKQEEKVIQVFAYGIYQVLEDNIKALYGQIKTEKDEQP